jgi:hypothetical protein
MSPLQFNYFRSIPTNLALNGPIVSFTQDPEDAAENSIGFVTFTGIATAFISGVAGTGFYSFQWYYDGEKIYDTSIDSSSDASIVSLGNSSSITLTNIDYSDNGKSLFLEANYANSIPNIIAGEGNGSARSESATLTSFPEIAIESQPVDTSAAVGNISEYNIEASIVPSTGENLNYQWQLDGNDISDGTKSIDGHDLGTGILSVITDSTGGFDIDFSQVSTFDFSPYQNSQITLTTNTNITTKLLLGGGGGGSSSGRSVSGGLGGVAEGTFTFVANQQYVLILGGAGGDASGGGFGLGGDGGRGYGLGGGGGGFTGLFFSPFDIKAINDVDLEKVTFNQTRSSTENIQVILKLQNGIPFPNSNLGFKNGPEFITLGSPSGFSGDLPPNLNVDIQNGAIYRVHETTNVDSTSIGANGSSATFSDLDSNPGSITITPSKGKWENTSAGAQYVFNDGVGSESRRSTSNANAIIMAGGGGGGANDPAAGGNGGGLEGTDGGNAPGRGGKGGTQSAGGSGGSGGAGELQGGSGAAGGGGGYYGGAGGNPDSSCCADGAGGGGSGFLHPTLITEGRMTGSVVVPRGPESGSNGYFRIEHISSTKPLSTTINGSQTENLTIISEKNGSGVIRCKLTANNVEESPIFSNSVSYVVVEGRKRLIFEAFNGSAIKTSDIDFDENDSLTINPSTFGDGYNIIQFHAPENSVKISMNMNASAGLSFDQSGGEGGNSIIEFDVEKNIEYTLLGINNVNDFNSPPGLFLYKGSRLFAAIGAGGNATDQAKGGDGGGIDFAGGNGGGSSSGSRGQGGVKIKRGQLSNNGIFGSSVEVDSSTLQSGDIARNILGQQYVREDDDGGRTTVCTKGTYWLNQGIPPCSNNSSELINFFTFDGVEVSASSNIIRGFKPGYDLNQTGGRGINNLASGRAFGGSGATGGAGGQNQGAGGGGSGYTDSTVTVTSSSRGGNASTFGHVTFTEAVDELVTVTFTVTREAAFENRITFSRTTDASTGPSTIVFGPNSGSVTAALKKGARYTTPGAPQKLRLTGNTLQLEDSTDNDFNDLQITPDLGRFTESTMYEFL